MDFTTRYNKLNVAQKQAVDTIEGPVMVIAGPGTGKTELLSMRAANILKKTDVLPQNILCLTFTESGASAMRERLRQIIGPDAYKIAIHTFHSFGTEIITQNGAFFYRGAQFKPAEELSSYELLQTIFDELDYTSPLASKMNGEYTYLRDTATTISELKRSGLTRSELLQILDANDETMDAIESSLASLFAARISKTTATALEPFIATLRSLDSRHILPNITPLAVVLGDSLDQAIATATDSNSTKPVTEWRNQWMKKNEQGTFVFKSRDRSAKLRAVSDIYHNYLVKMQQAALYDFDDMILRVVHAIDTFPELRFNLQEQYQYIMVDEFQDTNMAQMRILFDLINSEMAGDQPNIMVVGDDDQAIYSFQGADVGNIASFRTAYPATRLITLVDNYRSSSKILSSARSVITKGQQRLENTIAELDKTLTAHHAPPKTAVSLVQLPTIDDERAWVASQIARTIEAGTSPSSIAVLARRHHELIALLPHLQTAGILVNYERRDNILELDSIMLIEEIAQVLVALFEGRHQDAESLLPKLLAHPAFGISPITLWKLSLGAYQNKQSWLERMSLTSDFMPLHEWLITTSQLLPHLPFEYLIDRIIGHNQEPDVSFISPLFNHFFGASRLSEAPDRYLIHLEALRTIRTKISEYHPNEQPSLQTFLEFLRLHRELGSTITLTRSGNSLDNAINLMTAHKSKGLEFEHVFVIGTIDTAWGERVRTRSRLISYPENLPLAPVGDTYDERLRLFFVAMTRAKSHLTLSFSLADAAGKSTLQASFLTGDNWPATTIAPDHTIETLTASAETSWYKPLTQAVSPDMKSVLAPLLGQYKLSATHLAAFLDVSRGGPQTFLLNTLLRFPQAIHPSASYGSAIHAALQRAHAHLSATGKFRPTEDILHDFEENLTAAHLPEKEYTHYLQKGSDVLTVFLEAKYSSFTPTQKTELPFANQSVFLGEAHLTGSLDLVDIRDNLITVTDYKTGKPVKNWLGKTDYEKIKLHKFKQQLMFYHLLIRHSRDYNRYTVDKGVLQFVEPTINNEIIALEASFSDEDLAEFTQLICAVWKHITTLNLPDISAYEPTYNGMIAFENDLIEGHYGS